MFRRPSPMTQDLQLNVERLDSDKDKSNLIIIIALPTVKLANSFSCTDKSGPTAYEGI